MRLPKFLAPILVGTAAALALWGATVFAGVDMGDLSETKVVNTAQGGTIGEATNSAAMSMVKTAKVIISALAVVYLVYVGLMMVIANGGEESLVKQKRQLMYALVAFLFINIPGQIFAIFGDKNVSSVDLTTSKSNAQFITVQKQNSSLFVNFTNWDGTVEGGVLMFIRIAIVGAAIFVFVLQGLKIIFSAGNEDAIKEAKGKILYGVLGLIFLGVIEAWIQVAYKGDVPSGRNIFAQLANMALFFAGPVAIFFLVVGAYYYITSAGDEEKAKKGKSIVINTFIATIILVASYTFLKDLADFNV